MSNTLSPAFITEVQDRTRAMGRKIIRHLIERLVVNGETFGDASISTDAEFVTFYMGLRQYTVTVQLPPPEPPLRQVVDLTPYIAVVNPKLASEWRRRFDTTAGRLMGLR